MAILWGDMAIQELGFSPRDTGLLEAAKFTREEIAGIFGLPMTKLEISAARAEAEAGNYSYMMDTIQPRVRRMEQKLNESLVPLYDPSGRLFLAFDDCVPENQVQRLAQIDTRIRTGVTTINEERAEEGFEAVDYGDVPIMPSSNVPLGTAPPPVALPPGMPRGNPYAKSISHWQGCFCPDCQSKSLPPLTTTERQLKRGVARVIRKQRAQVLERLGNSIHAD